MIRTVVLISILSGLSIDACNASTVGYWAFDDPVGTALPDSLNGGSSTNNWSDNILNSFTATTTDGKGVYRLRRPGGVAPDGSPDGATSLVRVGTYESGWARYTAIIDNFAFAGTGGLDTGFQGLERVRFELLHDAFPSTTARMVLQRVRDPIDGSSTVLLSGEAVSLTAASSDIPAVSIYSGSSSEIPLTLQLDVDFDFDTYTVSYAFGSDPLTSIGTGSVDPVRGLRFGRITTFRKLDSTPAERIDIDSIRIEAVPEPDSLLLIFIGAVMIMGRLRR